MCGLVPMRGQDSNRIEGKGGANCQPTGNRRCSPSLESKGVSRVGSKDCWLAVRRAIRSNEGISIEGGCMLNQYRMTTQAARTGGPGGLCFSTGVRVGCRLLSTAGRRSPTLPYPTAFQPTWRATWASVVEADRSGATNSYRAPGGHGQNMEIRAQSRKAILS